MSDSNEGSLLDLIDLIRRKAPEYVDLLTAKTEEQFENAFMPLLEKGMRHLEENKKNFHLLQEEGLSAVLVGVLSIPGITAIQEANSNGHVDITIEASHCVPARRRLAEAKIYNGPEYHVSGLDQLLNRYSTGRDGGGLIIAYVKSRNIKNIVEKLRAHMDECFPRGQQGKSQDHPLKWSFRTNHTHNSGELLCVGHIGCNLYMDNN